MSWRYREPQRSHYDTEEEYEEACDAYWEAVDSYCDSLEDERDY
jgi:predicted AlkP superfamily phosphohydrolase/phosphomutase